MDWSRKLQPITTEIGEMQPVSQNIVMWLQGQADGYLLAHADDGVIWGKLEAGNLLTSSEVIPDDYEDIRAPLRETTLQQVRLFSKDREILVWRTDAGWFCRTITDGTGTELQAFDEQQLLWGDYSHQLEGGFTLLEDGQQGLRHAVPLEARLMKEDKRRIALNVRHYLSENTNTGVNRIAHSRLVNIEVVNYG